MLSLGRATRTCLSASVWFLAYRCAQPYPPPMPSLSSAIQVIEDWVARHTSEEVMAAMNAARVPAGPILSTAGRLIVVLVFRRVAAACCWACVRAAVYCSCWFCIASHTLLKTASFPTLPL